MRNAGSFHVAFSFAVNFSKLNALNVTPVDPFPTSSSHRAAFCGFSAKRCGLEDFRCGCVRCELPCCYGGARSALLLPFAYFI
jgi:hypothetical protein